MSLVEDDSVPINSVKQRVREVNVIISRFSTFRRCRGGRGAAIPSIHGPTHDDVVDIMARCNSASYLRIMLLLSTFCRTRGPVFVVVAVIACARFALAHSFALGISALRTTSAGDGSLVDILIHISRLDTLSRIFAFHIIRVLSNGHNGIILLFFLHLCGLAVGSLDR